MTILAPLVRVLLSSVWLAAAVVPCASAAPAGAAKRLIDRLGLQRIPQEGPWFALTYGSKDELPGAALPTRYGGKAHAAGSAIYLVETREDFSALHRLKTDEVWHFYGGDPIEMLLLYPDGHGETVVIGPDVFAGQHPQFTVPHGVWQGSIPRDSGPEAYSFAGDQLSPAFDYEDFEIGYRDELQKAYPAFAAQIAGLTREEFAARPPAGAASASAPKEDSGAVVTSVGSSKPLEVAPGMSLRELVGRTASARSTAHSVAHFTLEKGRSTLTSNNRLSEETFLVVRGHGRVIIAGRGEPVGPGSVVSMRAGVVHSLQAAEDEGIEFYAIETPAYRPEDFVEDRPAGK